MTRDSERRIAFDRCSVYAVAVGMVELLRKLIGRVIGRVIRRCETVRAETEFAASADGDHNAAIECAHGRPSIVNPVPVAFWYALTCVPVTAIGGGAADIASVTLLTVVDATVAAVGRRRWGRWRVALAGSDVAGTRCTRRIVAVTLFTRVEATVAATARWRRWRRWRRTNGRHAGITRTCRCGAGHSASAVSVDGDAVHERISSITDVGPCLRYAHGAKSQWWGIVTHAPRRSAAGCPANTAIASGVATRGISATVVPCLAAVTAGSPARCTCNTRVAADGRCNADSCADVQAFRVRAACIPRTHARRTIFGNRTCRVAIHRQLAAD